MQYQGYRGITWNKHPDGTIYTNGDLYLKPRDMAKIGYIMLNQGKWKNKQIVSNAGEYKINHEKVLMSDFAKRMRFKIYREENNLFIKLPDGQTVQLFPESKDLFFGNFKDIGQIEFRAIRDENGAIKHATRNVGFRALLLDKVK